MNGPVASRGSAPQFELAAPDPRVPVLVSGLQSAAIACGTSEVSFLRETRGGELEWGGVYAQGIRLTGPWRLAFATPRTRFGLSDTLVHCHVYRSHFESLHRIPGVEVVQYVAPLPGAAGVGRILSFRSTDEVPHELTVESEVAPYLAPVLVEGIKPYEYALETRGPSVRVTAHGAGLVLDSEPLPTHLWTNGSAWIGGKWKGELRSLVSRYAIATTPGVLSTLSWALWGGLEHTFTGNPASGTQELSRRERWVTEASGRWRTWSERIPEFATPEAPELEAAYRSAAGALWSLYSAPDPELTGLVAGFPWYSSLWCRDLAWMLPALLWLGDFDWVEESLRTVFRFQARSRLPILAGAPGELPMQISPGPIFLYGTSDTTLYYPTLVRRLVDHTGSMGAVREFLPAVERAVGWGSAKVLPATGLVANGGEIQSITSSASGVGRVQYGSGAVDTTIWDSTDRRDHAIDIELLWLEALRSTERLRALAGASRRSSTPGSEAEQFQSRLVERYSWPEEGYLADTVRADGTAVRRLRPNALRAVSAGLLDPSAARSAVRRAARDDLTTPWGIRTLSSGDSAYDPAAYHDGQVWPIATAWAADAAFTAGESGLGLEYLRALARMLTTEYGYANECFRGDRPEPFNSCFLLGFSVAPFLSVLFDSLWGLRPELPERVLHVAPHFPPGWRRASLSGLRLGDGTLDLTWSGERLTGQWSGPAPLILAGESSSVKLRSGVPGTLTGPGFLQSL